MIAQFIHKTLTPEIAPMVYIMMGVSVVIGFCFATGFWMGSAESILWGTGVLVDKQLWGMVLFATALTAEVGFITKSDTLISIGGVAGFCAWLFACINLLMAAHWYILVTVGLFHLLFHGYVVLASSLGYLRRAPIRR